MSKASITPSKKYRKKSLAEYLATTPELKERQRKETENANIDFLRSLPTYGKSGEALAEQGLFGSGYSEYLAGVAYGTRQSRIEASKREKEASLLKGYSAYLSDYEKSRISKEKSALSSILSQGITDPSSAYETAAREGLSHEDALRVSKTSVQLVEQNKAKEKESLRKQVLQKMISYGLKTADGIAYAKSFGFDEAEATAMAKLAEQTYRARNLGMVNASYQDLLDYQNSKKYNAN